MKKKNCDSLAGKDKAGRSLLHNAVLYEHPDIVKFLVEQYPQLINVTDNVSCHYSQIAFIKLISVFH